MRLRAFDVSDVDAAIERSRDDDRQFRTMKILKAKAFAQGFCAAAEDPEGAQIWLELFEEKAE